MDAPSLAPSPPAIADRPRSVSPLVAVPMVSLVSGLTAFSIVVNIWDIPGFAIVLHAIA